MKTTPNKIFTCRGLIAISVILLLGIIFIYFDSEKSGKINSYFEKKYPIQKFVLPDVKKYKIGFVTDAHAKTTKKGVIIPEALTPMQIFVLKMNNEFRPDFVVDGGDFIIGTRRFGTQSLKDYADFSEIFKTINALEYKVLGNHEISGMTRENWVNLNNYENSYYYFDHDKLRVIIFDSTLMPEPDDPPTREIDYNKELVWLKETLKNSRGLKKIIFSHYPFIPLLRESIPLERVEEFNNIASEYKVKAVFSGHVEVPYYEKIGGVNYFSLPGFYKSEQTGMFWEGSFAEINIGLRTLVRLFYKKEGEGDYGTLIIPSEEYENTKKEIMEKVNFLDSID